MPFFAPVSAISLIITMPLFPSIVHCPAHSPTSVPSDRISAAMVLLPIPVLIVSRPPSRSRTSLYQYHCLVASPFSLLCTRLPLRVLSALLTTAFRTLFFPTMLLSSFLNRLRRHQRSSAKPKTCRLGLRPYTLSTPRLRCTMVSCTLTRLLPSPCCAAHRCRRCPRSFICSCPSLAGCLSRP